jgi:transposase-like protein
MARKHKPEDIIGKLREAEVVLAQGGTVADACRRTGVTEQSYYRWRKEYGDLKIDQARRMKELEKENERPVSGPSKVRLFGCFVGESGYRSIKPKMLCAARDDRSQ